MSEQDKESSASLTRLLPVATSSSPSSPMTSRPPSPSSFCPRQRRPFCLFLATRTIPGLPSPTHNVQPRHVGVNTQHARVPSFRPLSPRPAAETVGPKPRSGAKRHCRVKGHAEDGHVERRVGAIEAARVGEVGEGRDAREGEVGSAAEL